MKDINRSDAKSPEIGGIERQSSDRVVCYLLGVNLDANCHDLRCT